MTIQKPAPDGRDECILVVIILLLAVTAGQFKQIKRSTENKQKRRSKNMKYYAFDRICFFSRFVIPFTIYVAGCIGTCCITEFVFVRVFMICSFIGIGGISMFAFMAGGNRRLWQCRYMLSETGITATIGKETVELLWKDCRYFGRIPCPLRERRILYFSDRVRYEKNGFSLVDVDGKVIYGRDYLSFIINRKQWEAFCSVLPTEMRESLEGTSCMQQ